MTGYTPAPNTIPYPTGADRVMDGDNAMKAIADRVDVRLGKWTSFIPVVGDMSVNSATAEYLRTADLITVRATLTLSTYVGSLAQMNLPFPGVTTNSLGPRGWIGGARQTVRYYYGNLICTSTYVRPIDPVSGNYWGNAFPATWVSGDLWELWFSYKPATAN